MLVSRQNFQNTLEEIKNKKRISFDFETTGLYPYQGDKPFALIIGTEKESFYYNFNPYPAEQFDQNNCLPASCLKSFLPILENKKISGHNIKFDLHMLSTALGGIDLPDSLEVHDTEVVARLLYNMHPRYNLGACVDRELGLKKDERVAEYIQNHGLWEYVARRDDPKYDKKMYYHLVPSQLMIEYGQTDGIITFQLEEKQTELLPEDMKPVYDLECQFSKVLFKVEKNGIKIDKAYCEQAAELEEKKIEKAKQEYYYQTNTDFVDSVEGVGKALKSIGFVLGTTPAGEESIDEAVLAKINHPIAKTTLAIREAKKRLDYFLSFLYYSDSNSIVHTDYGQNRPKTGRMSSSDPNLQNLPSDTDCEFPVKRAVIPKEGYFFLELDYKAQEFRLLLDYAQEYMLIDSILKGMCPHEETAKLIASTRAVGKAINFGLLYGMGIARLAANTGKTPEEAKILKALYFRKLQGVKRVIYQAKDLAEKRGYVKTWLGRRAYFPDPNKSYKAVNSVIQGGCADITKRFMVLAYEFLKSIRARTEIVAQVHDSVLFQMPFDEEHLIKDLTRLLSKSYPAKLLPQEASVEVSSKSWADLEPYAEGSPIP